MEILRLKQKEITLQKIIGIGNMADYNLLVVSHIKKINGVQV